MPKEIELYTTQYDFVTCRDRFTAFIGGIGSGKSFAGATKGIGLSFNPEALGLNSGAKIGLVVAPTYGMLRDATLRTYFDLLGDGSIEFFRRGEMLLTLPNGSEIMFRSSDDPNRLRGPNLHWAHIDEAGLCPKGTWEIVIGRLRADGQAGPCFITTTPKGRNWLYDCIDEMTVFRAKTMSNPYLDQEFIRSLESVYTGAFAAQELHGEFVGFEGLVYDEFDRSIHVSRNAGPFSQIAFGVDEGYTNPAVNLVLGFDNDGRCHVIAEYYKRRLVQDEFVAAVSNITTEHKPQTVEVDPSAAGLIAALRQVNIPARPANNAVRDGIQAVKSLLAIQPDGKPRLTIDPSCVNTIAEFESYSWRESNSGLRDEPAKENDHAMDALRYGIMAVHGRRSVWIRGMAG